MTEPIRDQCLDALCYSLAAIEACAPRDNPYPLGFSLVVRGQLPRRAQNLAVVASIRDGSERVDRLEPVTDKTMRVAIDLHAYVADDDASKVFNRVLAVAERGVMEDPSLGGIALDTRIVGGEPDPEDTASSTISGVLLIDVRFRHVPGDPWKAA